MKKIKINLVIFSVLILMFTGCIETPALEREKTYIAKIQELEKEINQLKEQNNSSIDIVSPVVEARVNYKNLPSYCKPQSYSIVKSEKKYYVRFPAGTIGTDFNTLQEAQEHINELAENSMKRWLESGGIAF
jgi:hypothetical protein